MSLALHERIQVTRNQQAVTGAEWESQIHHDRKNQRVVLSANVRREFASEWERMDFLSQLASLEPDEQLHRWAGDVWLRLDGTTAATYREWLLEDAVVGIAGTELDGAIGLRIAYTVSCGGFSGDSQEFVQLYGSVGTPVFGFSITGAQLNAFITSATTPDTQNFLVELTATTPGSESFYAARVFDTAGADYDLPMSASMGAYADDMALMFPDLIISYTGGVFSVRAPTLSSHTSIHMMIIERHLSPYSSLIHGSSEILNASLIPGELSILTGTADDEDESGLTALIES